MTAERRLLRTLAAAAVVVLCGGVSLAEEDPVIEEKPLSQLVKQLRSENRGLQLKASQALSKAPAELHARIVPLVIPVLKSERENDKFAAAQILGNYGPPARVAVPDLLPMLQGTQYERNRAAAAKALGQIFKDAEPSEEVDKVTAALVKAFTDKYSDVRREAITACGMIGPAAKACLPDLVPRFDDTEWLKDGECRLVRRATGWTCGRMGPAGAVHIDRLIAKMHQEGDWAPEYVEAMGRVGAVHENVVPNIVDKMERADFNAQGLAGFNNETGLSARALGALAAFGPKSLKAKDFLVRVVKGDAREPWECRLLAIKVLGLIGPAAADAVPVLEKTATFKGWPAGSVEQVNKAAAEAVAQISGKVVAAEK